MTTDTKSYAFGFGFEGDIAKGGDMPGHFFRNSLRSEISFEFSDLIDGLRAVVSDSESELCRRLDDLEMANLSLAEAIIGDPSISSGPAALPALHADLLRGFEKLADIISSAACKQAAERVSFIRLLSAMDTIVCRIDAAVGRLDVTKAWPADFSNSVEARLTRIEEILAGLTEQKSPTSSLELMESFQDLRMTLAELLARNENLFVSSDRAG